MASSCISGCEGCPSRATCKTQDFLPWFEEIDARFRGKTVISVMSGKGGVGKSTLASSLALSISKIKKTCLIDCDMAGPSVPRITNTERSIVVGEFLVPSSCGTLSVVSPPEETQESHTPGSSIIPYLRRISADEFDVIVLDTPPGTSDTHIALSKYIKGMRALIVTTRHPLSISDSERQIDFCRKAKIRTIGVVENMSEYVCAGCSSRVCIFGNRSIPEVCKKHSIPYVGSVPMQHEAARLADTGTVPSLFPPEMVHAILNEAEKP